MDRVDNADGAPGAERGIDIAGTDSRHGSSIGDGAPATVANEDIRCAETTTMNWSVANAGVPCLRGLIAKDRSV